MVQLGWLVADAQLSSHPVVPKPHTKPRTQTSCPTPVLTTWVNSWGCFLIYTRTPLWATQTATSGERGGVEGTRAWRLSGFASVKLGSQ